MGSCSVTSSAACRRGGRRSVGEFGAPMATAAAAGGVVVAAAVCCISMLLTTEKRFVSFERTVGSSRCWLTPSFCDRSGANFHTQKAAMISEGLRFRV